MTLMNAIAAASLAIITECDAQTFANLAWAFAILVLPAGPLLNSISSASLPKLSSFDAQELANTAWAFSRLDFVDKPLCDAISAASRNRLSDFVMQNLTNTAWAFAPLGFRNKPLMDAISAALLRNRSEFIPQELANMAWSCAKIGLADQEFLHAIASSALAIITEFITQDLANSAWACATLPFLHAPLFESISSQSIPKLSAFERQELSNTAWAFSRLGLLDGPLMDALSSEVRRRLSDFDAQALSNLADSVVPCASELLERLAPTLDLFAAGMPSSLGGWSGGAFVRVLQQVGVDNFGAAGSQALLSRIGVAEAHEVFVQRAQHRIEQLLADVDVRKDTFGLSHKRVLCYAEWDVQLMNGEPLRGALLRENGIRVGHTPPPAWLRSFATPINFLIGRDLCGEFQLVTGIGLILDAAPVGQLQGTVQLYSSSTPCTSCITVFRQFQLRFPRLLVTFANGERFP